MTFNFTVKEFILGSGNATPTLQFYKKGFNLRGSQPSWRDVILSGNTALTLVNAKADSLNYLKLFGGCEQRNLPSEYTQVEYLESDGTQYIDTGYEPNVNTEVKINFSTTTLPSSDAYMFHSTDGGTARVSLAITQHLVFFGGAINDLSNRVTLPIFTANTAYDITVNKDKTIVNSTEYTFTHTGVTLPTMGSIGLFGTRTGNLKCQGRVKSFSCNENNVLKINLIPCRRNSDSVLGMYDTVTGNFLTNAGTGSFTAGADVVPSPDTPMDIVCNNGVVKYGAIGKNLFDVNNVEIQESTAITADGSLVSNSSVNTCITYISVKPNTTYTISGDVLGTDTSFFRLAQYKADKTFISRSEDSTWLRSSYTFTTGANTYYIRFHYIKSASLNTYQLEQGSTATPYEPYQAGIYTDGITETVEITGKNLFNQAIFNTDVGTTVTPVQLQISNGTYTMSTNFPPQSGQTPYTNVWVLAGKQTSGWDSNANGVSLGNPKTFTVTDGWYTVGYRSTQSSIPRNPKNYEWQVEQGSTATAYEPCFDGGTATAENLFAIGNNYKDVQEVLTGSVTRNIGVKVFDGTENWQSIVSPYFSLAKSDITPSTLSGDNFNSICSHFVRAQSGTELPTKVSFYWGKSYFNIDIDPSGATTVNQFKQYLADQYNAGTPVIIVYPLATATTESVTAQSLTIQAGTNIVEITQASIDDLGLEVSYKATV